MVIAMKWRRWEWMYLMIMIDVAQMCGPAGTNTNIDGGAHGFTYY